MSTLTEFTSTLLTSYDVETVLSGLTVRLTEVLGLAGSGVTLARDGRLELVTAVPAHIELLERAQSEVQDGPCVTAFRTGQIVAVESLAESQATWGAYLRVAREIGIEAVAGVPMRLHDQGVGAVNLYSAVPRKWSERDLAAAQVMANMATAYLINASLYDKQRRLAEQLQGALESRIVIEQAKGVLSNEYGVDVDEAFARMRSHARTHGASVQAVARAVLDVGLRPG
ncbi:GAF and ANTAR domain-containing protein [Nocardioides pacificus]